MTNEDKKLIYEFSGWKEYTFRDHGYEHTNWEYHYENRTEPPYYDHLETDGELDLDFYFKYPLPKLQWFKVMFEHIEVSCRYHVTLTDFYLAQPCKEYEAIDEDPAEALGQALVKLIKEGK